MVKNGSNTSEICRIVFGRGILSRVNVAVFKISLQYQVKTNDVRVVNTSISMWRAGKNWMARVILIQSRGSMRKFLFEIWLLILVIYSNLALAKCHKMSQNFGLLHSVKLCDRTFPLVAVCCRILAPCDSMTITSRAHS